MAGVPANEVQKNVDRLPVHCIGLARDKSRMLMRELRGLGIRMASPLSLSGTFVQVMIAHLLFHLTDIKEVRSQAQHHSAAYGQHDKVQRQ
jgi:hypothetical protein